MLENIIDPPIKRGSNAPRAVLVEINELHEFSRIVRTLGTGQWIFRGHGDKDWKLESSLERQLVKNRVKSINKVVQNAINMTRYDKYRASDEMFAIDLFRRHARTKLPNLEHLVEWLAAMQHYGASTRLLDFTRSIYVALYFAFENRLRSSDTAIYAIHYPALVHSCVLSKEIVLAQQQLFAEMDRARRKDKVRDSAKIRNEFVKQNYYRNNKELQDSLISLADKCIETRSSDPGVIPVNVPGVNERLIAQSGLFLMPRTFTSFNGNLAASLELNENDINNPSYHYDGRGYPGNKGVLGNAVLIKIVISRNLEKAVWNMLAQANVSALNLFPGLDGIAKSIKYDEVLYAQRSGY